MKNLNNLKAKVFFISFLFVGASLIQIRAQVGEGGSGGVLEEEIHNSSVGGEGNGGGGVHQSATTNEKRMALDPRVREMRAEMEMIAKKVDKLRRSGDLGDLRLSDIAALKKANEKLSHHIEEIGQAYLGQEDRRRIKPIINKEDIAVSRGEDCEINPEQIEANCEGEVYRRVTPEVVGEVDLPEDFENLVTDIPRHTTEEGSSAGGFDASEVYDVPGVVGAR
ncbi:MAG: hypothetical protein K9K67_10870 [Bacteriovoracaceae bacterium]|nr:hypothetical protein [Bacteriovoracaceae bacterium]